MKYASLLLCSVLALSACNAMDRRDQIGAVPQLTFAQLAPLPLDVNAIEIKSAVPQQAGQNAIAHTPMDKAFDNYARQRFVASAVQGTGTLTVTLDETSLTKGMTNTDEKLTAWTKLDQLIDYKASIKATLRYDDGTGSLFKSATLSQTRGMQIPQRTSVAEREQLEQEFIENLIADLDKQIIPALQSKLFILHVQ